MNVKLVKLTDALLDDVWRIEQVAHTHPWAESMIRDLNSRGGYHCGLLLDDNLVGYFYSQHIVGEVTLLTIAIDPQYQGRGLGRKLSELFIAECEKLNAESAWLEVRESNTKAFSLYESVGFNEVTRRHNYYPTANGKEDALIMSYLFF
ncbi:MAG: ribosomal protein S18-alanine N-acetyltransferase [Aliivibrio sp.]|uniref:ribosomal protein S18-alanine N-acetyltransferase n=1 Tax=Aliivibrio sp. TaxID=1872443 RepID=UPI001A4BE1E3|nr:ribosomal protein S18-alanine N-acetyltransferase [Aliivibrio sp.]